MSYIVPESDVEAATLEILTEFGYDYLYGSDHLTLVTLKGTIRDSDKHGLKC